MLSMELVKYTPTDTQERAALHNHQPEATRRALAVRAASTGDVAALTQIMLAFQLQAGKRVPDTTQRTYRAGVDHWAAWLSTRAASVLRPGPRAGSLYLADSGVRGLSPATIRVRVAAIRKLYAALRDSGLSTPDPFDGVRLPTDPTPSVEKHPPYTAGQVEALLAAATDPGDRALILLCAHAGLRVQEALGLTWRDVDTSARTARIHGKGGKTRTVPLSGPTVAALGQLSTDEFILPVRAYTTAYDRLDRLAQAAGVEWRGFHAGRKHAGTELYKHVPLEHVQRLLGHASPEDTLRYVQVPGDTTRTAIQNLWG